MFNSYNDGQFKRVTKTTAKKIFDAGKNIYLLPCKASLHSIWFSPYLITKKTMLENDNTMTFEKVINSFEYYNCNNELGNYTTFYIDA